MDANTRPRVAGAAAIKVIGAWLVLPLFFLATGGDLAWWEAWTYCAVVLVPMTGFVVYTARHDPAFITRRSTVHEKEPAQRLVLACGVPLLLAALAIPASITASAGRTRPHLRSSQRSPPLWPVTWPSCASSWENRWAGRTIETYAGQQVISTGPDASSATRCTPARRRSTWRRRSRSGRGGVCSRRWRSSRCSPCESGTRRRYSRGSSPATMNPPPRALSSRPDAGSDVASAWKGLEMNLRTRVRALPKRGPGAGAARSPPLSSAARPLCNGRLGMSFELAPELVHHRPLKLQRHPENRVTGTP